MLVGQLMPGASVSLIVTLKRQPFVLPDESVARRVTAVTPFGNVEPLAGEQATVTPGQLSLDVTEKSTLLLLHWPPSVLATMFVGQLMLGGSVSTIVTVKMQPLVLPEV